MTRIIALALLLAACGGPNRQDPQPACDEKDTACAKPERPKPSPPIAEPAKAEPATPEPSKTEATKL